MDVNNKMERRQKILLDAIVMAAIEINTEIPRGWEITKTPKSWEIFDPILIAMEIMGGKVPSKGLEGGKDTEFFSRLNVEISRARAYTDITDDEVFEVLHKCSGILEKWYVSMR